MFKHSDIEQRIIIAEQSSDNKIRIAVLNEFENPPEISVVQMPKYGSGYALDYLLRKCRITTEYVCSIDVDTIPIHKNWLYVPIKLIQEEGFSFVGVHAEIESAYAYMGNFYCLCQHFRVGKTADFYTLSINGGFTKSDHRNKLTFASTEWYGWSDDAVPAHWWEDKYTTHSKFTFSVSHYLGVAPMEGRYGRYTDDLVFHFGFSYNWKMVGNKEEAMGEEFLLWMQRMEDEGLTEDMLSDILNRLIPLERPIHRELWNGLTKSTEIPSVSMNNKIDKLKET